MKKQYCPYCGQHVSERCDCAKEIAMAEADWIEEYENRPDVQYGWAQQDLIDLRRSEQ